MSLLKRFCLVCTVFCLATPALAMGPVDAEANLGVYGKYVWRGMIVTDDAVVQGDVTLGLAGMKLGVWGNMDLSDANMQERQLGEIDITLSYGVALPMVNLDFGFIYYDFPQLDDANTTEAFVSLGLNTVLSPQLAVYQDVDAIEGGYWAASVAHGVPLNPTTNLELTGGIGLGSTSYVRGYFGIDPEDAAPAVPGLTGDTSLTDAFFGAAVPLHPAPMVTVTPSVVFSTLMGDAGDQVDGLGGDKSAFVWGLSAGFRF